MLERSFCDDSRSRVDEKSDHAVEDVHGSTRDLVPGRGRVVVFSMDEALFDLVAADARARDLAREGMRERCRS
jgi:hypothetical protein